jgi:HlyD family secretion protein
LIWIIGREQEAAHASRVMPRSRRLWIFGLFVVLLIVGGVTLWRTPMGSPNTPAAIVVSGNIEAHETVLSFTQIQAPIVELPFDEGAGVAKDTILARVDDSLYRRQTEIDRANLGVANAQVAVSESTLAAAESNQTSDEFDLTEKQRDYARAEDLVKTNAISVQGRDLAYTAARQSAAALAHEQAMVAVATTNVGLAKANEAAVAAKLALDEVTLGFTTLRAPFAGVISVRQAELGQLAGPGVAIFTLDDLDHVWLRAYVNEPDIGKIRLGQAADVTTDTYPGKVYHGRVGFISPQAEFTPKTVETHAERVTLVYRIRIDIDNATHELLPGMPADAGFAPLPPGK